MRDRGRLYWILLGGLSFWIAPIAPIVLAGVLDPALVFGGARSPYISIPAGMILQIVGLSLPLVGIVSLSAATCITSGHEPNWEWILGGIYLLGPIVLLAGAVIVHLGPFSPNILKDIALRMLVCSLPAIPALLTVNIILSAMGLRFMANINNAPRAAR